MIFKGIWARRKKFLIEERFDSPSKVMQSALLNLKMFQEAEEEIEKEQQVRNGMRSDEVR